MNKFKEHFANHKKLPVVILVLILIVAAAAIFLISRGGNTYKGEVEATVLSHTSEVSGKILEMPVQLGQHVKKGDVLVVINSSDQNYAYEQLKLTLEKKKLALSDLEVKGNGDNLAQNSVSIAKANYNSAKSAYDKAYSDYQNALKLESEGAIPKDTLDNAKLKSDSAANALTATKAQLDNAASGTSAESMQLDIEQTESQLNQMKETLDKFTIKASCDGVILSKSYLIGDMVGPGYNLVDIASDQEKYFVFYYPKDEIGSIAYDQIIRVKSGGETYDGTVKYIDVESEYTPKDMQTAANKNRNSVKVKLLLPAGCPLNPGEEGEVSW
jgi:Multidrug resistance efflux pump